ncbi:MAG: hypothetical protein JSR73_04030 [Proteobacteria bacterium]|nr:hypothetical protein [Pseudomonadota bacterium]
MADGNEAWSFAGLGRWPSMVMLVAVLLGLGSVFTGPRRDPPPPAADAEKRSTGEKLGHPPVMLAPTPLLRPVELVSIIAGLGPLFVAPPSGDPDVVPAVWGRVVGKDGYCHLGTQEIAAPCESAVFEDVRTQLAQRGIGVTIVVATVPDWVDSALRWTFDGQVDAIQVAAARLGYSPAGFDLLELDPAAAPPVLPPARFRQARPHESTPGSLLFRRNAKAEPGDTPNSADPRNAPATEFLLVLLVGETPTGGVHTGAFETALSLARRWQQPGQGRIRILGPSYSGSSASIRASLDRLFPPGNGAPGGGSSIDIVSPSASSPQNSELFKRALTQFRPLVRSDPETMLALARFLGRTDTGWQCGENVTLLVEAGTVWGRQFLKDSLSKQGATNACDQCRAGELNEGTAFKCAQIAPFPIHIARLRDLQPNAPQATLPGSAQTSLNLADTAAPTDRVSEVTPDMTGATVELMVSGLFEAIERQGTTAIGVLASDKRDHLYLAQQIARHRPNVLMFAIESNLIYLHPDVSGYVRGTVIASTYSLDERTQLLSQPALAQHQPTQFGSGAAEGEFNGLLALLDEPQAMLDYATPAGIGESVLDTAADGPCGARENSCTPPIWISVATPDALVPMAADTYLSAYTWPALRTDPIRGAHAQSHFLDSHWRFLWGMAFLLGALLYLRRAWLVPRVAALANSLEDQLRRSAGGSPAEAKKASDVENRLHDAAAENRVSVVTVDAVLAILTLLWLRMLLIMLADRYGWAEGALHAAQALIIAFGIGLTLWTGRQLSTVETGSTSDSRRRLRALCFAGFGVAVASWSILPRLVPASELTATVCALAGLALAGVASFGDARVSRATLVAWRGRFRERWRAFRVGQGRRAISAPSHAAPKVPGAGPEAAAAVPGEYHALSRWFGRRLRRVALLLGFGTVVALSIFIAGLWVTTAGLDGTAQLWLSPVETALFGERLTLVRSFVSPTSVAVGIGLGLIWWALWNVRRIELLRMPEIEVGVGELLAYAARQAQLNADDVLRSAQMTVGRYVVGPLLLIVVALVWGYGNTGTLEGRAFNAALLLGSACALTAFTHTLVYSWRIGFKVRELLSSLGHHPATPTFEHIRREPLNWGLGYQIASFTDLQSVFHRIRHIGARMKPVAAGGATKDAWKQLCRRSFKASEAACKNFDQATVAGKTSQPASRLAWVALDQAAASYVPILKRAAWGPVAAASDGGLVAADVLADMEYVVVCQAAFVLRDLLTRVISGLTAAVGGILILLLTHLVYDFQGRLFWLGVDSFAVASAAAVAVVLLYRFERDAVLSRLWGTTPGKINLFGELTPRLVGYALIVIAAVMSAYFPEVVGNLGQWIGAAAKIFGH